MPRDPQKYREYMRTYMRERYARVRAETIARLGGCCLHCGTPENLQFDHVDPAFKLANLTTFFYKDRSLFEAELIKCQLLCASCHNLKTLRDSGKHPAVGTHGTLSAYRYCKCPLCRAAATAHHREYRRRRREDTTTLDP